MYSLYNEGRVTSDFRNKVNMSAMDNIEPPVKLSAEAADRINAIVAARCRQRWRLLRFSVQL